MTCRETVDAINVWMELTMSRKFFGTDGVRGRVGQRPITPDFVLKLGYCAGKVLSRADVAPPHRDRPAVLIGKDTRISGYMLESALESGLSAAGVDTFLVGPMPTPGVAFLTRALRLSAGDHDLGLAQPVRGQRHQVLLRRRHEAARRGGERDRVAARTSRWRCRRRRRSSARPSACTTPRAATSNSARARFPSNLALRGVKLVVDCAHGANYRVGVARLPGAGRRGDRDRRASPTA